MTHIVVERDVCAAMRDGTVLRADVYRPDAPGRYPALLQRTPYSKDGESCVEQGHRLAERGYVVVLQDVRGRFPLRRRVPARLLQRGPQGRRGRLRLGRVGRGAPLVGRAGRHLRRLLLRVDPVGAGAHAAPSPRGDDSQRHRREPAGQGDVGRAPPRARPLVERQHAGPGRPPAPR